MQNPYLGRKISYIFSINKRKIVLYKQTWEIKIKIIIMFFDHEILLAQLIPFSFENYDTINYNAYRVRNFTK